MMNSTSSISKFHKSKIFFSKNELSKILSCYSIGVSRGNWKDYAISFKNNQACFYIFKNSFSYPDCILTKINNSNKKIFFRLEFSNNSKNKFNKIEDLLALLIRKNFTVI